MRSVTGFNMVAMLGTNFAEVVEHTTYSPQLSNRGDGKHFSDGLCLVRIRAHSVCTDGMFKIFYLFLLEVTLCLVQLQSEFLLFW